MSYDRVSKKDMNTQAEFLAKKLGKPFGNCWIKKDGKQVAKKGCWTVDYNPIYGGAVVHEIVSDGGGVDEPFGSRRLKPSEFVTAMRFANRAIELKEKKE